MFDKTPQLIIKFGLPGVALYHILTGSIFLNTAAEDATKLEYVANQLLVPCQYLLAGHKAVVVEEGYRIEQRFEYTSHLWQKTAFSMLAVPFTTGVGLTVKAVSFLSKETRERHQAMVTARDSVVIHSNNAYYKSLGIPIGVEGWIKTPKHKRHAADDGYMEQGREALKEIARILNKYEIPFWLDCGTALGAQRYGGVIPWDNDIDIGILEPDHFNVRQALKELDQKKYTLQDWSSRDKPYTYLKVYAWDESILLDIYHHRIDTNTQLIQTVISNYDSLFVSDTWRDRETATGPPESYGGIFPLKKVIFDGIELYVPNDIIGFLQRRYGENIEPAKIYNEATGEYEKDLTHPYWQLEYAH